MEKNPQISSELLLQNERNKYDEACKKVLSFKCILAWILKDVLEECQEMDLSEIQKGIEPWNPHEKIIGLNIEDEFVNHSRIYFDLVFLVVFHKQMTIINIEAQSSKVAYHLKNRALYYGCRLIDRQKNHPLGFRGSNFDDLYKVATIWLRNDQPLSQKEGRKIIRTLDLMTIAFLHPLNEIAIQSQNPSAQELLSILFVSQESYETKKQILEERYGILVSEEIEKELRNMCTFSEGLWNQAWDKAWDKAWGQAFNTGISQGKNMALQESVRNLMKNIPDMTLEKALEILDIPAELRESLQNDPEFNKSIS